MAFEAITTQEQLDAIIKDRLERAEKKYEDFISPEDLKSKYISADELKKYEGYLSPEDVEKKYEGFISPEDVKKKDEQIKKYERDSAKTKIAHEYNLPFEMAGRINGETEKEMREDAKSLASFVSNKRTLMPSHEPAGNDKNSSYKEMLKTMKGE